MLLQSADGIICDITGMSYKNKFTYYSLNIHIVEVYTSKRFTYPAKLLQELDMGEICMNKFVDRMKKYVKPESITSIACDLCPETMSGDFKYYYITVDKVDVDTDNKDKSTSVDSNYTQIRCCSKCYLSIDDAAKKVKEKINKKSGKWS